MSFLIFSNQIGYEINFSGIKSTLTRTVVLRSLSKLHFQKAKKEDNIWIGNDYKQLDNKASRTEIVIDDKLTLLKCWGVGASQNTNTTVANVISRSRGVLCETAKDIRQETHQSLILKRLFYHRQHGLSRFSVFLYIVQLIQE